MFTKSILKDPKEPQIALKRIMKLLEEQSANGKISADVQKKILGDLLKALSDCLIQHPELLHSSWDKHLSDKNEIE